MNDQDLAYYGNRVVRPPADPRRDAIKRAISWTLVALIHLFFLAMLTFQFITDERFGRRSTVETILDLSLFRNPNAPHVNLIKPQVTTDALPEVTTAPITIPPVKPIPEQPPAPPTPGDVLKSIGEALACGASSFENLTDAQRAHCRHQPWLAKKLPNGNIVMDAPPKDAQPEIHLSGADANRQEMQRGGPACPIMLQTPCVDDIINGRSSKPF